MNWEKADFIRTDYRPFDTLPPKPANFEKMCQFAKVLSTGIPFSRIDFYEINGHVFFGEITFFPAGGYAPFSPDEWDEKIGNWIDLSEIEANNIGRGSD